MPDLSSHASDARRDLELALVHTQVTKSCVFDVLLMMEMYRTGRSCSRLCWQCCAACRRRSRACVGCCQCGQRSDSHRRKADERGGRAASWARCQIAGKPRCSQTVKIFFLFLFSNLASLCFRYLPQSHRSGVFQALQVACCESAARLAATNSANTELALAAETLTRFVEKTTVEML
jgi:hypothetical protein